MKTLQPRFDQESPPVSYTMGRLIKALIFLVILLFFGIITSSADGLYLDGPKGVHPDKMDIEPKIEAVRS